MENYFLEFRDITKQFPGVRALDNVSMYVNKGEIHALLGENGAGKSTLIKILAGVYPKDSGKIILDGKELNPRSPLEAKAAGISVIHQEISLITQMSAVENMYIGKYLRTKSGFLDWKRMRKETRRLFEEMNLDIDESLPVSLLNVGQCQMIEIARAVMDNAKVIIMDEPTSSLTESETEYLFKVIDKLKEDGITIIYISHRLDEIVSLADSATVIKDGQNVSRLNKEEIIKERIIRDMVGRDLDDYFPAHNYQRGEEILRVKDLKHGKTVRGVSFTANRGEILGFSGLMGAGRTETMLAIFGAYGKAVEGEVIFNGEKVKFTHPKQAIKAGMAYASEDRKGQGLSLKLSVAENIMSTNYKPAMTKAKFIAAKKEKRVVAEYIEKLSISTPSQKKKVVSLSGGNQQKVVFAKWLNTNAELYVFDEPTRGIDVGSKSEIYKLMCQLAEQGKAVIVISSELPEIVGISDRVVVMYEGRVTGILEREELSENRIMALAVGHVANNNS